MSAGMQRHSESSSGGATVPSASGRPMSTSGIIVCSRQRGNPVLKHVRNMAWEYGDIVPDYQLGATTCALYLSLRYHQLNPNYIFERLKQLGRTFELRVLLVLVDVKDPHLLLRDLAKTCLLADCVLMLAFTQEEAARYLETYKSFENKPPDLIMERTDDNLMAHVTDTLTKVRSVNRTDVMTLMSAFRSIKGIIDASEEDISLCPGFGPQKAKRLHHALNEPFIKKIKPNKPSSLEAKSPTKQDAQASKTLESSETNKVSPAKQDTKTSK